MPGPVLAVAIERTARMGFRAALYIILGHALIELPVVIGLFLGLAHILKSNTVSGTIGIVGALVLVWMAWGMLAKAKDRATTLPMQASTTRTQAASTVLVGATASASNPMWSLWWATVGLALCVSLVKPTFVSVASFYLGHIMSDVTWYSLVGGAVAKGRQLMSARFYRGLLAVCGVFLVAMAVLFTWHGYRNLFPPVL